MSSPFDEARYRVLLEGLEISEIPLSALENEQTIGAEYYAPEYLRPFEHLLASSHDKKTLRQLCSRITDGDHGSADYADSGIPFVLSEAVRDGWIRSDVCRFITAKYADTLARSRLRKGDVLVTKTGVYFGKSAVVPDSLDGANTIAHVGILRPNKTVDAYYLSTFLNSKFGYVQLRRRGIKATRPEIKLVEFQDILVACPSDNFQSAIRGVVLLGLDRQANVIEFQRDAEQTLLRALGLENWQPPEPLSYTRSSRDAFAAERLDAEFFAPRVADLLEHLNRDGRTLGDVAPARHERFDAAGKLPPLEKGGKGGFFGGEEEPDAANPPHPPFVKGGSGNADAVFDYIEIGGVRSDGTVEAEKTPYAEAPSRATWIVRSGDVLTSTVRPIRRLSALVTPDQDGFVCSSGFVVLQPHDVAAEVLLAYLRLPPVCELMDLHTSASLYPAISESDLLALPFPSIAEPVQAEIVASVRAAHQAKRRAQALLDSAKRAVEIAIEDSEAAALAWLEELTERSGGLAAMSSACNDEREPEKAHDATTDSATGTAPATVARPAPGPGEPAGGLSPTGGELHPELHGAGERAGGPGTAAPTAESTRPLDATRELATAEGTRTYTEVAESLAVNIVRCLEALFDGPPEDIAITPEWICGIHRRIAGELFPDWAGRFRSTDVQVGSHLPPPAFEVAVQVRNFCLDLDERLRHLHGAESIAGLLAWVDWRFQWIHPFKDFNGRVGRILLVALAYKLGLPPLDPAQVDKAAYFAALRSADAGNIDALLALWLERLTRR